MIFWLRVVLLFYVIITCMCEILEELKCVSLRDNELNKVGRSGHEVNEIPSMTDLVLYLNSVQKVVRFSHNYKLINNLNVAFGLVLINVNLKNEMKFRNNHIVSSMRERVQEILSETDEAINNFLEEVNTNATVLSKIDKLLLTLFINETMWMERMVQFDGIQIPDVIHHTPEELQKLYTSWDAYYESLKDKDQSDENRCLSSLALNSVIRLEVDPVCQLPEDCHNYIRNGPNIGYYLAHRILLLLTARLGRGCIVFSKEEDQKLMEEFCSHAYTEAEFIAMHDHVAMDILMEFVSFCAMSGRVDFLQRSWVNFVLLHQLPIGCFTLDTELVEKHKQIAAMTNHREVSEKHCNLQMTAITGVALSTAARYVIASTRTQDDEEEERESDENLRNYVDAEG